MSDSILARVMGTSVSVVSYRVGVVSRDIKSSNVLIRDETGDCVIADLGLALQLVPTDNASDLSNHGQVSKPHPPIRSCDMPCVAAGWYNTVHVS